MNLENGTLDFSTYSLSLKIDSDNRDLQISCQPVSCPDLPNGKDIQIISELWKEFCSNRKRNKFNHLRTYLAKEIKQHFGSSSGSTACSQAVLAPLRLVWLVGRLTMASAVPASVASSFEEVGLPVLQMQPLAYLLIDSLKNALPSTPCLKERAYDSKNSLEDEVCSFLLRSLNETLGLPVKIVARLIVALSPLCSEAANNALRCATLEMVSSKIQNDTERSAPVVELLLHFGIGPADGISFAELLQSLVAADQWQIAERLVLGCKTHSETSLSVVWKELAVALITTAMQQEKYKQASGYARQFEMRADFPTLSTLYLQQSVSRLAKKHQWQVAMVLVGENKTMQKYLIDCLVKEEQNESALHLSKVFNIPLNENMCPHPVLGKEASHSYLPLLLPKENIIIVDTVEKVLHAKQMLMATKKGGIGLDVEWQADFYEHARKRRCVSPTLHSIESISESGLIEDMQSTEFVPPPNLLDRKAGNAEEEEGDAKLSGIASILQMATTDYVFIIDLLAFSKDSVLKEEANRMLELVFTDASCIKLGFGFPGDLGILRSSWPDIAAFDCIKSLLEVGKVTKSLLPVQRAGISLSETSKQWLGKPLNKSERMSDWALRPLTEGQLHYAALDAHCLVSIFEAMNTSQTKSAKDGDPNLPASTTEWFAPFLIEIKTKPKSRKAPDKPALAKGSVFVEEYQEAFGSSHVIEFIQQFSNHCASTQVIKMEDVDESLQTSLCKSIALLVNQKPMVVIVGGDRLFDLRKVARQARAGRRSVKIASEVECVNIFGFAQKGFPPCAHKNEVPVLMDQMLEEKEVIYTGGGEVDVLLQTTPRELIFISSAQLGDFSKPMKGFEKNSSVNTDEKPRPLIGFPPGRFLKEGDQDAEMIPGTRICFMLDSMLGRLGRWLRALGMDVEICSLACTNQQSSRDDLIAKANQQGRLILTRDRKVAERKDCAACYLITGNDTETQLEEVVNHFGLLFKEEDFMSRCSKCNTKGFSLIAKEEVQKRNEVKDKVFELVEEFWECNGCKKIYWRGPKFQTACEKLSNMLIKDVILNLRTCGDDDLEFHS